MEMKVVVKFLEMISGSREIKGGFFRQCFLQNTPQKAAWETLTYDLKAINLEQEAIFGFGAKNAQNQVFVTISISQGNYKKFCSKYYTQQKADFGDISRQRKNLLCRRFIPFKIWVKVFQTTFPVTL